MVQSCVLCKKEAYRESGISFHRLPTDQVFRNKWIKIIRNCLSDPIWKPLPSSLVCSDHFKDGDVYYLGEDMNETRRRIKKTAVPCKNISNVRKKKSSKKIKEEDDSEIEDISLEDDAKVVIKIESAADEPKKKKKKKIKEDEDLNSDDEVYLNLDSVYDYLLPPMEAKLRHELIKKNEVNKRQITKIQNLKKQHVKLEKKIRVLQKIIATVQNDTSLVIPNGFSRKRKFIPETEIETQCDDDDEFTKQTCVQQNSQIFDVWKPNQDIPESEIETQCDDDDEFTKQTCFQQNSQTYDDWVPNQEDKRNRALQETVKNNKNKAQDCEARFEKTTKDSSTCTVTLMKNEEQSPHVLDIHGCKYFGQFISNELLRFDIDERYVIMHKIIELLRTKQKRFDPNHVNFD